MCAAGRIVRDIAGAHFDLAVFDGENPLAVDDDINLLVFMAMGMAADAVPRRYAHQVHPVDGGAAQNARKCDGFDAAMRALALERCVGETV